MLIILKMKQIKETYKEVIEIPVYDDEEYPNLDFLSEYSDTHYKTKMKSFNYEDILAITTKETPIESRYHCSRGGALIFVKDRETPFLTADLYSVKKIYRELNKNPLACLSGLNQIGSPRIYAKEGKVIGNEYVLPNGVRLHLTNDAVRKLKFVHHILTKGTKQTCFYKTKKIHRKK